MAENLPTIDPTLYGGDAPARAVQFPDARGDGGELPTVPPAVPISGLGEGDPLSVTNAADWEAAQRERAPWLASAGAAIHNWDTVRLAQRFTAPDMGDADPSWQPHQAKTGLNFVLTENESEWLDESKNAKDFEYRVAEINRQRELYKIAGDNKSAAFLLGALDIGYYALTPLAAGAARLARGGRAAAAVASGVSAGALQVGAGGPNSTDHLLLNVLANAAAGALVVRGGKVVPRDPNFPAADLNDLVGPPAPTVRVERRLVSPAKFEDRVIPATADEFDDVPNKPLRAVETSKPNFGYRGDNFELQFDNPIDKAAYIVAGKGKSQRHQDILNWAMSVTGKSEAELVALGTEIRATLRNNFNAYADGERKAFGSGIVAVPKHFTGSFDLGTTRVLRKKGAPARTERVKVSDDVWEEVEVRELPKQPNPEQLEQAATASIEQGLSGNLGNRIMWNVHKSLSSYGPVGKKIADLLLDNNNNLRITSMESQKWAIRADLTKLQRGFEDAMLRVMGDNGAGLWTRITNPTKALRVQKEAEHAVQMEMYRRELLTNRGLPITHDNVLPWVKDAADRLDALHARALHELKAAGVEGAEDVLQKAGWHHRRWTSSGITDAEERLMSTGLTRRQAQAKLTGVVALALRRGSGMSQETSRSVAQAILDRARRKGMFEDSAMSKLHDAGTLATVRDMLKSSGADAASQERILDELRNVSDEGGRAPFMKSRVDLDYRAMTVVNGVEVRVTDLLDTRLTTTVDKYLDGVSAQAALARVGLRKASDVTSLRTEFARSIKNENTRAEALKLFDNTVAYLEGRPAGEDMHKAMRVMSAYGRMIALANSGLWQFTEYASIMQKYGVGATLREALSNAPLFKAILRDPSKASQQIMADVLAAHSNHSTRMRPLLQRFEDNFEMRADDGVMLAAQQAGQLVPYVNGMKYIHGHQARITSNLIVKRLEQAANGDKAARAMLERYGLESQVVDRAKAQFDKHGWNIDKWSDSTWDALRPGLYKMMDEAVLKSRVGDMPAFAQFDKVGKFLFMYRSFVLTAHNKLLAGTASREGLGAVSMLMLYQFPLSAMAVQAQTVINGKKPLEDGDLIAKTAAQMGSLGMLAELVGWATGSKQEFGAPGLIPVDRAIGAFGATTRAAFGDGSFGTAAEKTATLIPVVGAALPVRGLMGLYKEE